MIIDVHAHALSERFIRDLATTPVAGLKSETSTDGYYAIRRAGDDRKSTLDPHLFDLEHRLASLKRRKVDLQLVGPPPFLVAWPGGVAGSELVRALHKMLGGRRGRVRRPHGSHRRTCSRRAGQGRR